MKRKKQFWLAGFAFLLFLGSCQKGTDFLYVNQDPPPAIVVLPKLNELHNITARVKELGGNGKVDILWIIDNSASMETYQTNLANNMDKFIAQFALASKTLDWRMGIISSDMQQKPFLGLPPMPLLDGKSLDPVTQFKAAVRKLGTSGDGYERFYSTTVQALKASPTFVRSDAMLAVFFVTDTVDHSHLSSVNTSDFLSFLADLKGDLNLVLGYGALAYEENGCDNEGYKYKGSRNELFFKSVHSKIFPLCDSSFGSNLANVGQDIVSVVTHGRINLKERPLKGSLKVIHAGKSLLGGVVSNGGYWTYDPELNAIIFNNLEFATNQTEEVTVTYELPPSKDRN